jgi:membrane-associated protein
LWNNSWLDVSDLLALIAAHGAWIYGGLFAYAALKSGSLPLFAGMAAGAGALDAGLVALAAFSGGYLGDEARFAVARHHGHRLRPASGRWAATYARAVALMQRYGAWYIFLYRYPKGMRTIGAFPVGLGTMPWRRFTALNAASALLWAGLLVGGGYLAGTAIEQAALTGYGTAAVVLLGLAVGGMVLLWRRQTAVPAG